MKRISNDEFAKRTMLLARQSSEFEPEAVYDADGDCIEFLAKPDPFRAERVDDLVTVYYSQETGEVMGSLIKGVSQFCRDMLARMPGFRIEIQDGRIRLEHLFLARLWSAQGEPESIETLTYRKLAQVAGETSVDGELCLN